MAFDITKFYAITDTLETLTKGEMYFDKSQEPNWGDIMYTGRYCRIYKLHNECCWCYDEAFILTEKLDISNDDKAKLKSGVYSAKALCFIQMGKNDAAIELCDAAISFWKENAEAHCNKGVALNNIGNYDLSLKSHKKAIELNPEQAESWNAIGNILLDNLKKPLEAIEYLDRAISLSEGKNTHAWINKGNALHSMGHNEEAIVCYETAYDIDPKNNVHAMLNKANLLYYVLNKKVEAAKLLKDVKQHIDANHPELRNLNDLLKKIESGIR